MTDTANAAPSDAEIDAQWRESVEKHETTAAFVRDFARTVLAKWGTPPQISGFTVPQADSQPAKVWDYPPMPDFDTVEQHIYGACRRYITQDMLEPIHNLIRDVIDADRAARAPTSSVLWDAERYRYLRDGDWREHEELESVIRLQLNTLWDAKIDAARAAKEGDPQ